MHDPMWYLYITALSTLLTDFKYMPLYIRHTRIILPALIRFRFRGVDEYLEDLVSQIHGPQLNGISIIFLESTC